MDIKQLEAFVHVVENRSFSKAGEIMFLTQPTISSRIVSLEQELMVKLINRTTKEIYPSEAGKLLYPYAKEMLTLRGKMLQSLAEYSHTMQGSISIAASTIPGKYFLPKLIQSFHEKFPDIKFDISMLDSAEVAEQVATYSAEIGFVGTRIDSAKCEFSQFANDRLVIITPNELRFRAYQYKGFPIRQLLEEDFISREIGSGTRHETDLFLREMGIAPEELKTVVEVRSTDSIKELVSEGLGVAIISKSACEDFVKHQKILAFDFESVNLRRNLYIIRHKHSVLTPVAQAFYSFAKCFYQ